jgi:hypothetical protein
MVCDLNTILVMAFFNERLKNAMTGEEGHVRVWEWGQEKVAGIINGSS